MSLPRPTICGCLLGLVFGAAFSGYAAAANIVIKRFPDGTGPNAVGVIDASEDTEIEGPQALTTDASGKLYLLDQVNGRIVGFDPKEPAAQAQVLEMPERLAPTDLIVRQSDILVWDGSVHTLQPDNTGITSSFRGLEEVHTRAADDHNVASAFAQMGSEQPGDATDLLNPNTRGVRLNKNQPWPRQYVATRGGGSVIADIVSQGGAAARIEVRHQEDPTGRPFAELSMKVHDRLGAVEFLEIDRLGRLFVYAEDIPTRGGIGGAFVARFSPDGQLEGIYELPLSDVPLSRRFVTVSADGDVYFLRTERSDVEVLGIGFQPMARNEVIRIKLKETGEEPPDLAEQGPITAVRPLTRQRVIEAAFAFEGVQWLLNPAAYGRDPDTVCTGFAGRIRRPFYLHGKLGQQVRGVPYCWGCMGSLAQIRARLERGVLAGNICTHNTPRSDVTGVDCSSFVSAAWGLSTHFTTAAIPAITRPVSPWDLRPGDALDKPGSHVMLFLRFTANRMAEVMEASPGACKGRVCRNVYPLASLLARGYRPVRFRGLENDTSTVADIPNVGDDTPVAKRHHGSVKRAARRAHGHRQVEENEHHRFVRHRHRERLSRQ